MEEMLRKANSFVRCGCCGVCVCLSVSVCLSVCVLHLSGMFCVANTVGVLPICGSESRSRTAACHAKLQKLTVIMCV